VALAVVVAVVINQVQVVVERVDFVQQLPQLEVAVL
jgi:hypothetical protein